MGPISGNESSVEDAQWLLCEQHGGTRVLLAEDNPVNQSLMQALLRNAGIEVELATDGAQAVAVAALRRHALILMDVQMPILGGLEATRRIRRLPGCEHVPIIAITGGNRAEDRQACLAAGMNDHLTKPVKPALLYAMLQRWLATAFDPAAGLCFFGGNDDSYRLGLQHFADLYGAGLRCGLDRRAELQRELHALSGAAAVLGMQAVATQAQTLEQQLQGVADAQAAESLTALQQQLAALLPEVRAQLQAGDRTRPDA